MDGWPWHHQQMHESLMDGRRSFLYRKAKTTYGDIPIFLSGASKKCVTENNTAKVLGIFRFFREMLLAFAFNSPLSLLLWRRRWRLLVQEKNRMGRIKRRSLLLVLGK